ncbi:MAG: hypothetical protein HY749_20510 [Gammaproteobacteria bacterium]|nr:hypothetical protein [Gammaproteobacteria bacterium]MBI5616754.1 hypothetical protein [Gammaproteobacteria bacterium]
MPTCASCGNDYDKAFQIVKEGRDFWFDSFECAIQRLAPRCEHCGCAVIGHGVENAGHIYCCAHCASAQGETTLKDRSS